MEQVAAKYNTLEPLAAMDALFSPENIRKNLQGENDIYKFEYCSIDENTYKIGSFIPLEWDGTKLVKALLASMDVSQEKKAEKKAEARKEAKKAEKERLEKSDDTDTVTITASSLEELLQKIKDQSQLCMSDNVQTEAEKKVGQKFDYSV